MIKLPRMKDGFEHENNFYFTCKNDRISKLLIQYELFSITEKIPGEIIECGVFKGISLIRFSIFRDLFQKNSKKIIGFDTFGKFPSAQFSKDVKIRKKFLEQGGNESISIKQLQHILKQKKISENVELVKGDLVETAPDYIEKNTLDDICRYSKCSTELRDEYELRWNELRWNELRKSRYERTKWYEQYEQHEQCEQYEQCGQCEQCEQCEQC